MYAIRRGLTGGLRVSKAENREKQSSSVCDRKIDSDGRSPTLSSVCLNPEYSYGR